MEQALPSFEQTNLLKQERDRFVAFAFAGADVLMEIDRHNIIQFADGATAGFLGEIPKNLVGKDFLSFFEPGESALALKALATIREQNRLSHQRLTLSSKTFRYLPVNLSGVELPTMANSLFLTLSVVRDALSTEELKKRDIRSGLLQKKDFVAEANIKIRTAKEEGKSLKVSLLDLPDLKDLLDFLDPSHAANLLIEIADYIRGKSIDGDTAGIVEPGKYSLVHEEGVAPSQLIDDIKTIIRQADPKGIGIDATVTTVEADSGSLTAHDSANALLYMLNQFAESERENFTIDTIFASYESMLGETLRKISSFKKTVHDADFNLAYQPIVDLQTGLVHHYESLVRMVDDTFNNPFHFITFGEQTDLIGDFDLVMIQRVLDMLDELAIDRQFPMVSVNMSGRSLSSNLFMDALLNIMLEAPKVRKQLVFEITESAKIDDMNVANNFIQELRQKGNHCCLDDFGVAESSFDYLRTLQVDYIKIDGSYVKESLATSRGRHLLRAMVGMCRNLGITTIGEMVEEEKTANILWESGVQYGQGYLFGKPDTDVATLRSFGKHCSSYQGIVKAKKMDAKKDRQWWERKD